MELIIIETPDKIFASDVFTSWETSRLGYHFVDGKIPEKSFKNNWYIIAKIPQIIECEVVQPPINKRYELIDESLESKKIK